MWGAYSGRVTTRTAPVDYRPAMRRSAAAVALLLAVAASSCGEGEQHRGADRSAALALDAALDELKAAPAVAFDVEVIFGSYPYFVSSGVASDHGWRAVNEGPLRNGTWWRWRARADGQNVWIQNTRWKGSAEGCWELLPSNLFPSGVGAQGPELGYLSYLDLLQDAEWDSGTRDAIDVTVTMGTVYALLPEGMRDEDEDPPDKPIDALVKLDGPHLDQLVIYADAFKEARMDAEVRIRYRLLDEEIRVGAPHPDVILTDPSVGCGYAA